MRIKSKVFAAAATLTLAGGIGATGVLSASGAHAVTPAAVSSSPATPSPSAATSSPVVTPSPSTSSSQISTTAPAAPATTRYDMCDELNQNGWCLNAWGGGPLVKAYTPGVQNDDFAFSGGGSSVVIQDLNTGWYVGDYLDNQGDAKAGLNSGLGAWGSYFTAYSCGVTQGVSFHNNHWNAWLNGGDADGDQFYLNSTSKCYYQQTF